MEKNAAAVALGRLGGLKGGAARAASLTPEQRTAMARFAAQQRWGGWTACGRCGHSSKSHKRKSHSACECEQWVAGRCAYCAEWCFSGRTCQRCYSAIAAWKLWAHDYFYNGPQQVAERERQEQKQWLKQGHRTLTEVRRYLSHSAPRSARQA